MQRTKHQKTQRTGQWQRPWSHFPSCYLQWLEWLTWNFWRNCLTSEQDPWKHQKERGTKGPPGQSPTKTWGLNLQLWLSDVPPQNTETQTACVWHLDAWSCLPSGVFSKDPCHVYVTYRIKNEISLALSLSSLQLIGSSYAMQSSSKKRGCCQLPRFLSAASHRTSGTAVKGITRWYFFGVTLCSKLKKLMMMMMMMMMTKMLLASPDLEKSSSNRLLWKKHLRHSATVVGHAEHLQSHLGLSAWLLLACTRWWRGVGFKMFMHLRHIEHVQK